MRENRKQKKKTAVFIAVILALIVIAGAVAGVFIFKELNRQYIVSQHPLKYSDIVERYAQEYGLDKFVIYAYIKTESGFDPDAVSDTGARGLMQITEVTFDWIKFRLGDGDDITYDDMFEPETNIRYGAYLVSYLTKYFEDPDTAAAAYFSGIGEVSGWLADSEYSSDGIRLDKIPSRNAAHYVNKINNALQIYRELYA